MAIPFFNTTRCCIKSIRLCYMQVFPSLLVAYLQNLWWITLDSWADDGFNQFLVSLNTLVNVYSCVNDVPIIENTRTAELTIIVLEDIFKEKWSLQRDERRQMFVRILLNVINTSWNRSLLKLMKWPGRLFAIIVKGTSFGYQMMDKIHSNDS